jgi:hypothetical protein
VLPQTQLDPRSFFAEGRSSPPLSRGGELLATSPAGLLLPRPEELTPSAMKDRSLIPEVLQRAGPHPRSAAPPSSLKAEPPEDPLWWSEPTPSPRNHRSPLFC